MRAVGTGRARPLVGSCPVPPDKSISHRAAILAAMANGASTVHGFSTAGDCRSTLTVLRAVGVAIREDEPAGAPTASAGITIRVDGPFDPVAGTDLGALDCGRSGTTMRLVAGLFAGAPVRATLSGERQLLGRPMERVAEPLRAMGAEVRTEDGRPPIRIRGGGLHGIEYRLPVASAQVKSAVLLAGLRAEGQTTVVEPVPTRDHTERLLAAMGAAPRFESSPSGRRIHVERIDLIPIELSVPGDLSSAAFLMAAAALVPGSDLRIEGVGLNPTRTGFLRVLERMGADVRTEASDGDPTEPAGVVRVRHSALAAAQIGPAEVPGLIDELPLIGLLATQADGATEVRGAGELRVKESDRIAGLVGGLRALGATVEELPDGFVVTGPTPLTGAACDAREDHRLAMTFAVAGLIADGPVRVRGLAFAGDSFPGFAETLAGLSA